MDVDQFIARWDQAGGTERQNAQLFATELCALLGVDAPTPGDADYAFERHITHTDRSGTRPRAMDLYKRGAFILEAKQSRDRRRGAPDPDQPDLLGDAPAEPPLDTPRWNAMMAAAHAQARAYVHDLPADHDAPPFLIVVDVGRAIELYADFTGQGRNYSQFPDRARHRIAMPDLADGDVRDRLRAVWADPWSLDPALHAAAVTKDIAARLARVAASLERDHPPPEVAGFLMRCLFSMFAEDVGLLPEHAFRDLLDDLRTRPQDAQAELTGLWALMDAGGYDRGFKATLRRFNGGLFADATALPVSADDLGELTIAAQQDWRDVEPAIFGTFLERALDVRERASLGAHYTPRAYVERLVVATVMEPLRRDWLDVRIAMDEAVRRGEDEDALSLVQAFHHTLCTTRVLDPACGTGNFLYVALELMKRLEGEVLDSLDALGGTARLALGGETVEPSQFLGLELNPRAAAIAEVVLWVGYLKWQLRTGGLSAIADPVLRAHGNIRQADAVLSYDARVPLLDEGGAPVRVWDRVTTTTSPVTGLPVPDLSATVPAHAYRGAARARWPEAEFIVGNPPFIGGKDLRAELGDGYAEAVWAARPEVPGGADFVMQWWDEAARRLTRADTAKAKNPLRRFGFITTNSITQAFSRRVIERFRDAKPPLHLTFAVADHPWVKGAGRAAVRIAMTVAERGAGEGVLGRVAAEADLNTDAPIVRLDREVGAITAKLTVGADVNAARPLLSNEALSSRGVALHGAGFIVTPQQARGLGLGTVPGLENHIRPYLNGRDVAQRSRGVMVIDLFGLTAEEVRERFPAVYAHLLDTVKPERDGNRRATYRDNWWLFGEARADLRDFTEGLPRFIVTVETTKHRLFRVLPAGTRPDNKLVAIGLDDPAALAVLSSRVHVHFSFASGNWMGVGNDPVYAKTKTFDPYPFPALLTDPAPDAPAQASLDRLRDLGRGLEALRDDLLGPDLTLTALYNRVERRRDALHGGAPLTEDERADHARHRIALLAECHDDIDRAVLHAYGWGDLADALVGRPGGTVPHDPPPAQEAAQAELLTRLVALNAERRAEEAAGDVRWLRPAYQRPRLAARRGKGQAKLDIQAPTPTGAPLPWPADARGQLRAVADILAAAPGPVTADTVARAFKGRLTPKRRARVAEALGSLTDHGLALSAGSAGFVSRR
ncbi:MAG: class I SAM-dependent DNA methyltransferase [Paracoccaceae bacterium]